MIPAMPALAKWRLSRLRSAELRLAQDDVFSNLGKIVFSILFAFGCCSVSAGQQAATQSVPQPSGIRTASPPIAGPYRISGKVLDAHTGAVVARCSVQIADVKARTQARTAIAGEDGSFSFEGLALGKYSLTGEARGYVAQSYEEHEQYSTAIAVGPGKISEGLTFPLTAEAVIAGTVIDDAGEPVRGAQVRLFQDLDTDGIRTTRSRQSVVTDDRGMYELAELHPGAYFLVVTGRPWYTQRLQRGGDAPRSNEPQALDVAYPATYYPGVTDQDAATPIPVKGGDRLEANLTMAAQPALRLHLTLPAAEGDPASSPTSLMVSQSIFGQVENLPTEVNYGPGGSMEVDGLLPGHYDVTLNRYGPRVQGGSEAKHFQADVAGGATELSDESAVGEITVTGSVVSGEKLPKSAGVALRTPHARRQYYSPLSETGEFKISVPPGTYEVVGGISQMYLASMKTTGALLAGRMLTVKAGESPKLEITAASGYGEIEGTALLGEKPASGVMVLLAPEDPKNNQILFRRDQSDSDGTFTVQLIVPGRYRLLAIEKGWELEWANPAVLQAFLAKSVAVVVKGGDRLTQRVEVQLR